MAEDLCGTAGQFQVCGCGSLLEMILAPPTSIMHRVTYLVEYTNPSNQVTAKKTSGSNGSSRVVLPDWYINKEPPS